MKMEQHINKQEGDNKEKIAEQPKAESENYREKDEKELIEMATDARDGIHKKMEDLTLIPGRSKEKIDDNWKILELDTLKKHFQEAGFFSEEESESLRRFRKGLDPHNFGRPESGILLYGEEAQKAAAEHQQHKLTPDKIELFDKLGSVERDALKVMEEIINYRSTPTHKFFEALGNEVDNIKIERIVKEKGIKPYDEFLGEGPKPGMKELLEHIKQSNHNEEVKLWNYLSKQVEESGSEDVLKEEPKEVQQWYQWVKERVEKQGRPIDDVIGETSGRVNHAHLSRNEDPKVVESGEILRRAYLNGIGDKNKTETTLRNVGEF